MLMFPVVIIGILYAVLRNGQNHAVAEEAVYLAQTSSVIQRRLGLPIAVGASIGGRVFSNKETGHAHLEIPISGPNGRGTLLDWTQKRDGKWHVCSLTFRPESGSDLPLVAPAETHCRLD